MKKHIPFVITIVILLLLVTWWRMPLLFGKWTKQTLYIAIIDAWHGISNDTRPHALWIDDDSNQGIFKVKIISDEIGIKPTFAVIADGMNCFVSDSLIKWQKQGIGIMLHGYRHEPWANWNEEQIKHDIKESRKTLSSIGFDTTRLLRIIVPPHACNNRKIRTVIQGEDCQMITGASLVNPDRNIFQLGRIFISQDTDTSKIRRLLQKAYDNNNFVIFGTHSSNPEEFSEEKTRKVLEMAKEMGFIFDISE